MEIVFLVCVAVGGTLLVCQFLLSLLGIGHHDIDHDHDVGHHDGHDNDHAHDRESWFVSILTFRSLVAAVTFFGLGGLIAYHSDAAEESLMPLAVATASGVAALLAVGWIMKLMQRLKAEGTIHIDRAVGTTGTVYLSIPGNNNGTGKVTVKLQSRTVEYLAVTRHEALTTGTPIQVVAVVGPDTVEVVATTDP
jgi:hypothetical protein